MAHQTVHLNMSGRLENFDIDANIRNGSACVNCENSGDLLPVGPLVGGAQETIYACTDCGAEPGTAWDPPG
jgi:hypothetical protein